MTIQRVLRPFAAIPLYPLLAAAYPVVFLYAQNVHEAIAPYEVLVPLGMSLAAALGALIVFRALTADWTRAALISTLLVTLFFTYGMAWDWLQKMLLGQWVLLGAWGLLAVIGVSLVWRLPSLARVVTLPLNAIGTLLLTFNLVIIAAFLLNLRPAAASSLSSFTPGGGAGEPASRPDIYWVIVEEYGAGSALQHNFHFDNSPFLDALRQRGLYIAEEATANYLKTAPSLLSSRSLSYLDGAELRERASGPADWGPIYHDLKAPFEVEEYLGGIGYRFIYLGMYWSPTSTHPSAEINYVYDKLASEFIDVLQRGTMLRALEDLGPVSPYDWRRNRWNQTNYELKAFDRASELGGPKFVIAHLALDHGPYVFHADGSFVSEDEEKTRSYEENYIDQLKYTNVATLAWLDKVLAVPAAERPIIIIQADEGPWTNGYRRDERGFDWTNATVDELKQKFGILNAFYLPDRTPEQAGLYASITAVNTFRALFGSYFGLDLPLLPDRNYIWPNQGDIYTYIDVTDRLNGGP